MKPALQQKLEEILWKKKQKATTRNKKSMEGKSELVKANIP